MKNENTESGTNQTFPENPSPGDEFEFDGEIFQWRSVESKPETRKTVLDIAAGKFKRVTVVDGGSRYAWRRSVECS